MKTTIIILAAISVINSSWTTKPNETRNAPVNKIEKVTTLGESFSFFRTHRQGKGITATWGLFTNIGVTDFVLERTYEDPSDPYAFWEEVGNIPCTSNRSFKFTEQNVFPGFISYRVVAMNGLTQVDVSEISTVHIVQH
jgi:hypothetical protein